MNIQATFEEDIKKFIKNDDFNSELESYIVYYGAILSEKCQFFLINDENTSDEKKERLLTLMTRFEQLLSPALKNAFLKGYQIGYELINNKDTELNNEVLREFSIESQFLDAVENYYSTGLYEFIRTAETQEFILFLIRNFEDIKPTLQQVLTEITRYGSLKVLEKLKDEKEVVNSVTQTTALTQLPLNQFVNITPSIRAYVMASEKNIEVWSLVWNSTLTTTPFNDLGEVTIVHRPIEQLEKDVQQQSIYATNLSNMIGMKEVLEIRVKMIQSEEHPRILSQSEYMILIEKLISLFEGQTNIEKENIILWTY